MLKRLYSYSILGLQLGPPWNVRHGSATEAPRKRHGRGADPLSTVTIHVLVGPTNLFAEKKSQKFNFRHPPYRFSSPLPLSIMWEPPAGIKQKSIPPTSFHPPYHFLGMSRKSLRMGHVYDVS